MNLYLARYEPDAHGVPLADVVVREAIDDDLVACGELLAQREGTDADACTTRLRRVSARAGQIVLVACHEGRVVGYAQAGRLTPASDGGHGAPDGWYLSGIVVAPELRRRGIGRALTVARCEWVWHRADRVYYVASDANLASLALHGSLGFREVTRDFTLPGVTFTTGTGVLFSAEAPRRRVLRFRTPWRSA